MAVAGPGAYWIDRRNRKGGSVFPGNPICWTLPVVQAGTFAAGQQGLRSRITTQPATRRRTAPPEPSNRL